MASKDSIRFEKIYEILPFHLEVGAQFQGCALQINDLQIKQTCSKAGLFIVKKNSVNLFIVTSDV